MNHLFNSPGLAFDLKSLMGVFKALAEGPKTKYCPEVPPMTYDRI